MESIGQKIGYFNLTEDEQQALCKVTISQALNQMTSVATLEQKVTFMGKVLNRYLKESLEEEEYENSKMFEDMLSIINRVLDADYQPGKEE